MRQFLRKFFSVVLMVSGLSFIFLYRPPDPFEGYKEVMNNKTLVVVATMHRVGSTKIFNAIRKIYEVSGDDYYSSFINNTTISPPYNFRNPAGIHIIKVHSPDGFVRNQVITDAYLNKLRNFDGSDFKKIFWITAKRDLRDMSASQVRVSKYYPYFYNLDPDNYDEISNAIRMNLSWYYAYKDISDYEISYENFLDNPHIVIERLSIILGRKLNHDQIEVICKYLDDLGNDEKLKSMDIDTKRKTVIYDHHHITSHKRPGGYHGTLGKNISLKIEQEFSTELRDLGYLN